MHMSDVNKLQEPTHGVCDAPGPQTAAEAKQFYDGFRSGITAYAREIGHSTLKSNNPLLARLLDEIGLETIELFERFGDDGEQPKQ